jgi:cytochrome c oxidase subunit 2
VNALSAFWPAAASAYADRIDLLMWSFTVVVALLSAPVFILIFVFAVRYRRGRPANREHVIDQSLPIELSWALIPFLLTVGFFVYAAWLFFGLHRPPADAMTVDVVAKQWMWKFQHPEGQREIDTLHVPAGQPVKLVMTSQDVIHSLYLPELRIKQDVLPGRYTTFWFKADRPGVYRLLCSQFCGMDHAEMGGRFVVLAPGAYVRWLETSKTDATLAGRGAALYRTLGCSGCHEAGSTVRAPPLAGLAGSPVALQDGRVVKADERYLRDSLLLPNKDVAAGYAPIMPTYAGQADEEDVLALIAYLQSLGPAPTGAAS